MAGTKNAGSYSSMIALFYYQNSTFYWNQIHSVLTIHQPAIVSILFIKMSLDRFSIQVILKVFKPIN